MRNRTTFLLVLLSAVAHSQTVLTPTAAPYEALYPGPWMAPGLSAAYSNADALHLGYAAGAGVGICDDIQLAAAGLVTGFEFAYYDSSTSFGVDALVRFFGDLGSGRTLLAEFGFAGLQAEASAAFIAGADLRGTGYEFTAPRDMELEIAFSSSTALWLLADGPSIGHSDNVFSMNGTAFTFGDGPEANFYAKVYVVPEPSGVAALIAGMTALTAFLRRRAS